MKTKQKTNKVAVFIIFTILVIIGFKAVQGRELYNSLTQKSETKQEIQSGPCKKIGERKYDCTDEAVTKAIEARDAKMKTLAAYTTAYSRTSSCHNPRGKECLTAIGRDTEDGVTVACPRNIPLGTMVIVNNKWYRCEDRYAKYLDGKRGIPTFDIFMENHSDAVRYGLKKTEVKVM